MLTANMGPFAISITQVVLMLALLVALGVGYLVGRRQQVGGIGHVLSDMLLIALLLARIAFVVIWFDIYRRSPWSVFDIRDGGFAPWAGMVTALLVAAWHGWRRAALRKPLILGLAAGALVWGVMLGALRMLDSAGRPRRTGSRQTHGGQSMGYLVPALPTRNAGARRRPATGNGCELCLCGSGRRCYDSPKLPVCRSA
jgi:hypothetical protein